MRKLTLALVALATVAAIAPNALADSIGFSVNTTSGNVTSAQTPVILNAGPAFYEGLSSTLGAATWTGVAITVSSQDHPGDDFIITGNLTIGGNAGDGGTGDYVGAGSTSYTAAYFGGGTVSITSAACGGICLSGTANTGSYSASPTNTNAPGGFSGSFTTTFISSYITTALGDGDIILNPDTNDGYTTTGNLVTLSPNGTNPTSISDTGTLYTGGIQDLSVPDNATPEPSSLFLLGTGLLGLATVILVRKGKPAKNLILKP